MSQHRLLFLCLALSLLTFLPGLARAQENADSAVQIFTASLGTDDGRAYAIRGLGAGQSLYFLMENLDGSLDPYLELYDLNTLELLASDDDSGGGLNASLSYTLGEAREVFINVRASPAALPSEGQFRLWIGLNEPGVLRGGVRERGPRIASFTGAFVASENERVQSLDGYLDLGAAQYYRLEGLFAGDTLYAFLANVRGNLDPYLSLSRLDSEAILAEDDDGGPGLDAALAYEIPEDGDYLLLLGDCCGDSFGAYRLLLGLNSPEVLNGQGQERGLPIGALDAERSQVRVAIDEAQVSLSSQDILTYPLNFLRAGDKLYLYLQGQGGELLPQLNLNDFSGKPLASLDWDEASRTGVLEYTIREEGGDYFLSLLPEDGLDQTGRRGDFRLLVGTNAFSVLTGEVSAMGPDLLRQASPIQIRLTLQHLDEIDPQDQSFRVVVQMQAEWNDPAQAFDASDCRCSMKEFVGSGAEDLFASGALVSPHFRFLNQQGEREIQSQVLEITWQGGVVYREVFAASFNAPGMRFEQFPLDEQSLFIDLASAVAGEAYRLEVAPEGPQISPNADGQGWRARSFGAETLRTAEGYPQVRFHLELERELNSYLVRWFFPYALLLLMGWAIYWLDDYPARISAGATILLALVLLMLFTAQELPQMAYLSFWESLLIFALLLNLCSWLAQIALLWRERRGQATALYEPVLLWSYPLITSLALAILLARYWG